VTPFSLVEIYWHFGEMYCLHLQGQGANAKPAVNRALCSLGILFNPEDGAMHSLGTFVNFHEINGTTSQKMVGTL
jgi:hypothetical protein